MRDTTARRNLAVAGWLITSLLTILCFLVWDMVKNTRNMSEAYFEIKVKAIDDREYNRVEHINILEALATQSDSTSIRWDKSMEIYFKEIHPNTIRSKKNEQDIQRLIRKDGT